MTRGLRTFLMALMAVMCAVAAVLMAWRAGLPIPYLGQSPTGFPLAVVFFPLWLGLALIMTKRRIVKAPWTPSASHRRFLEGSLVWCGLMALGVQLVGAYAYAVGPISDPIFLRAMTVVMGVFLATRGNALAKLDPPTGGEANMSVWTRSLMQLGWVTFAVGLLVVAAGLFLNPGTLRPVTVVAILAAVLGEFAFRRKLRRDFYRT